MVKSPKLTKCKICRTPFKKMSVSHKTCSPPCAIALVSAEKEKKSRKADRVTRERLKTRQDWLRNAQSAFNRFIRERDKALPCISCGRHHTGQYHAGHFLTTGAHPVSRFDEANCHKQCSACNNHLSGNVVLYRQALILKIGQGEVDRLEGPQPAKKWTIEELQAIQKLYREKYRELVKGGL